MKTDVVQENREMNTATLKFVLAVMFVALLMNLSGSAGRFMDLVGRFFPGNSSQTETRHETGVVSNMPQSIGNSAAGSQIFDLSGEFSGPAATPAAVAVTAAALLKTAEAQSVTAHQSVNSALFDLPVILPLTENDPPVKLESWMVDESFWSHGSPVERSSKVDAAITGSPSAEFMDKVRAALEPESEKPLKLASWMLDDKCFQCRPLNQGN